MVGAGYAAVGAGQLSDALLDVPPVQEQENDTSEWLIAWATILLLINGNAARVLTATQRKRARDLLRVKFEQDAARNALRVTDGNLLPDAWRLAVMGMITGYARQMAVAGAGTLPPQAIQQSTAQEIARQMPYLARFAAAVAAGSMTASAIAARTKLYGKSGWQAYYMAQGSTAGDNIVERWISRDDKNTCSLCAPRHGQYYLPGQPPWPGDCLGSCRCERVQVVDAAIFARLSGRR